MSDPVVVVGAGLSGLYACFLLQQAGQRVLLLEARERVGGRVLSRGLPGAAHRIDLGPSWFWPGMNPRMEALVSELGLSHFTQFSEGATVVETSNGQVRQHHSSWEPSPPSQRIVGGTQALIEALQARLDERVHLQTGTHVLSIQLRPHGVELELQDGSSRRAQLAAHVIVTVPPRLMAQDMALTPAWPEPLMNAMRQTPTWMAGQAKFVAMYPKAFWRAAGLSGAAMSQRGPMVEIHDASDARGEAAALFGFVGASPEYRAGVGREELQRQSLAQFTRLFGAQAASPLWSEVQDWAQEPLTATRADLRPLTHHPTYQSAAVPDPWADRVWLAGTERSPHYGGYLEGALDTAMRVVNDLLAQRKSGPQSESPCHTTRAGP